MSNTVDYLCNKLFRGNEIPLFKEIFSKIVVKLDRKSDCINYKAESFTTFLFTQRMKRSRQKMKIRCVAAVEKLQCSHILKKKYTFYDLNQSVRHKSTSNK